MRLKRSRKILSVIFAVLIAVSTAVCVFAFIIGNTLASESFYEKHFITSSVSAACEAQLDARFEVLAKKSNIPLEVFNTVKKNYNINSTMKQALSYIFDENDATLGNRSWEDYFYEICTTYLDGNNMKYKEQDIKNIAAEAARIYSDSVGIHNADEIQSFVSDVSVISTRVESFCVIILVFLFLLSVLLYRNSAEGLIYVGSGLISGGIGSFVASVALMIKGTGQDYVIRPEVYRDAVEGMIKLSMRYSSLFSIAVIIVGGCIFAFSAYKINQAKSRKETRYLKVIDKL